MGALDFLRLPEAQQISNLDAPSSSLLHKKIIQSKLFLYRTYLDFYSQFKSWVPDLDQKCCVELGSGGGFLKEIYPTVITSDVIDLDCVDQVFSGLAMPFQAQSIDAFFMVDVFHHVPDSKGFLSELSRCLKTGGRVVMVEPANTAFGRFIYQNFHHEAFDTKADWTLEPGGPLSIGNGALPWIVFKRDFDRFTQAFPEFKIRCFKPHTPFRYLLSGGLSLKQLLPNCAYSAVKAAEFLLKPLHSFAGLFYTIVLEKE